MERLLSVLERLKNHLKVLGKTVFFFVAALKTLQKDFGNTLTVDYLKMKLLFEKLNNNDRTSLKDFQQQLKRHIKWLKSIGYHFAFLPRIS